MVPICLKWEQSRVSCRKLSSLSKKKSSSKSLELSETSEEPHLYELPFNSPRIKGTKRIGPHHRDVYSIIFGSLLGDGHMEKGKEGSRMMFYQGGANSPYLLWLHSLLVQLGYCKKNPPILRSRPLKDGGVAYFMRFESFTFTSFNWIQEVFYPKGRKVIPSCLASYLTPLALAIWVMDDGCKLKNKGFKFCTNGYTLTEVKYLSSILSDKYDLKTSIIKTGAVNQYNIYITKSSMSTLITIVKPHMHGSMLYKLYDL